MSPTATVRRRLAELVVAATDGEVGVEEVLAGRLPLGALGVSSLGFLRLVDAVEAEYGVDLDPAQDPSMLDSVDGLLRHLVARGLPTAQ